MSLQTLYNHRGIMIPARTRVALFLLLSTLAASQVLPRPHTPSAVGKPAPKFTLQDEHGKAFSLASLRGKRVLLIFYRGYW
jgi:cytochrome oxidase Cu insertion factor (SCO1/SenC/PrrC family)